MELGRNDARDKEVHEGRREDLKKGLKKEGLKGRKGVMREERMWRRKEQLNED